MYLMCVESPSFSREWVEHKIWGIYKLLYAENVGHHHWDHCLQCGSLKKKYPLVTPWWEGVTLPTLFRGQLYFLRLEFGTIWMIFLSGFLHLLFILLFVSTWQAQIAFYQKCLFKEAFYALWETLEYSSSLLNH